MSNEIDKSNKMRLRTNQHVKIMEVIRKTDQIALKEKGRRIEIRKPRKGVVGGVENR